MKPTLAQVQAAAQAASGVLPPRCAIYLIVASPDTDDPHDFHIQSATDLHIMADRVTVLRAVLDDYLTSEDN